MARLPAIAPDGREDLAGRLASAASGAASARGPKVQSRHASGPDVRWSLLLVVLLASAAAVQADGTGCSAEAPCLLVAEVTDDRLTVAPAALASVGPYVLRADNHGALDATLVLQV